MFAAPVLLRRGSGASRPARSAIAAPAAPCPPPCALAHGVPCPPCLRVCCTQDGDKDISITEFLKMAQKNDLAGTSKHPGFRLSAGMLATTKEENKRLLRQMGIASK